MAQDVGELVHLFVESDLFHQGRPGFGALVVVPRAWEHQVATEIIRHFTSRGVAGAVLSFRQTHEQLMLALERADVDRTRVLIMDTGGVRGHGREENILHLQGPTALTDCRIALAQFAQRVRGNRFVVIDDLNALRDVRTEGEALRFIGGLMGQAADLGLKVVGLFARDPTLEPYQRLLAPFFDKVIELG